jgi:hypothetical protein
MVFLGDVLRAPAPRGCVCNNIGAAWWIADEFDFDQTTGKPGLIGVPDSESK